MDFSYSPEEKKFREEIRMWIQENVPGDYGTSAWPMPDDPESRVRQSMDWQAKLYEGGWMGIDWPKEYGGRGATPIEVFIFHEEMSKHVTPPLLTVVGVGIAAPTIMTWGTEEQKNRYLKKILSGEEIWCQGFSEPDAGSDVASLKTFAADHGDHYLLNGQKVWISSAHMADWCALLVRTNADVPNHKGLTYLSLDMKSDGIEIRPIRQITDDSDFNEIFFNDVKVPKEHVLGEENDGWRVAITTLMHERVNLAAQWYGGLKRNFLKVVELAKRIQRNGQPLSKDPIIRRKLVQAYNSVETQRLNHLRMRAHVAASDDPGPIGSIFKLIYADANQALHEIPVDILGPYAELLPGSDGYHDDIGQWMKMFLRSRANSIEGGTSEILRNIIGERVLGLPR